MKNLTLRIDKFLIPSSEHIELVIVNRMCVVLVIVKSETHQRINPRLINDGDYNSDFFGDFSKKLEFISLSASRPGKFDHHVLLCQHLLTISCSDYSPKNYVDCSTMSSDQTISP